MLVGQLGETYLNLTAGIARFSRAERMNKVELALCFRGMPWHLCQHGATGSPMRGRHFPLLVAVARALSAGPAGSAGKDAASEYPIFCGRGKLSSRPLSAFWCAGRSGRSGTPAEVEARPRRGCVKASLCREFSFMRMLDRGPAVLMPRECGGSSGWAPFLLQWAARV